MKKVIVSIGLLVGFLNVSNGVDLQTSTPSTLKIKVYKVAFSTSQLCTNLQTVYEKTAADATFIDFIANPKLGENLSLADGTYPCVVIEMSDNIKFTTTIADGPCSANTEYTIDVCRSYQNSTTAYTLIDGTTGTCSATNPNDDRVALYLSTASTTTSGGNGHTPWQPPTSTSDSLRGFTLTAAFVKSGAKTGIFYVDATGKVNSEGEPSCGMAPPSFGFRAGN